ncbi:MAG: hypothetical protein ABI091_07175, partial [Ferruginibacter sp.]
SSADPETIGKYLINQSLQWKPGAEESDSMKIGTLYKFDLFIKRQRENLDNENIFEYQYRNIFYAESQESGIKYKWNQGHLNIDNPKLAARYFLNAIDRVDTLKEKYQKNLEELEHNIPMLRQIIIKPFSKDQELAQLKQDVSKLEREISINIQKKQMVNKVSDCISKEDVKVASELKIEKPLLPKKELSSKKIKGIRF